jgi:hypothetical protein
VPVQRFRDLDEARRALWISPDDPSLANRIRRLWRFSARLATPSVPRGLRRFRGIEEANAERECRVQDRVRTLLAERAAGTAPSSDQAAAVEQHTRCAETSRTGSAGSPKLGREEGEEHLAGP